MPAGTNLTDDDDFDADDDNSNLVKDLRKQLKDKSKREEELANKLAKLETADRQRTITEALTAKGLSAKAAKFYPQDAELSEDAITAWVTDNADVFGATAQPQTPEPNAGERGPDESQDVPGGVTAIDPNTEAAYRRLQAAQLVSGTATTRDQDMLRQIADAKSPEELTAFLRTARA